MNGPEYKERYQLLQDRRRVLFEFERLGRRIVEHAGWAPGPGVEMALLRLLHAPDEAEARNAPIARLERERRELHRRLVVLARVWVALEKGERIPIDGLDTPS